MNTNKQIRSILWWGLGYLALGLGLALIGIRLGRSGAISLGCGFCGAAIGCLWHFFYWRRHEPAYEGHLRQERIKAQDEMLILLRRQAGYLTYKLTMALLAAIMLICAFCSCFELWLPLSKYGLYIALIAFILEYACGLVIFNRLKKQY